MPVYHPQDRRDPRLTLQSTQSRSIRIVFAAMCSSLNKGMALIFETWYADFGLLFLAEILLLSWYLNNNFKYWKNRGIHFLPPVPYFGNVKDMFLQKRCVGEVFGDMHKQLKGHRFGGFFELRTASLIVRDPELIKRILVQDFANFHQRGIISNVDSEKDPLAFHLFNLNGYSWRVLRTKLTPTFTAGRLRHMFQFIAQCGAQFQSSIPMGDVELKDLCQGYTMDVIASCAFGVSYNVGSEEEIMLRKTVYRIFKPNFMDNFHFFLRIFLPSIGKIIGSKIVPTDIQEFFMTFVKNTVDERRKKGIKRSDFLDLILQIQEKGSVDESFSEKKESQMFRDGVEGMDDGYHKGKFELTDNLLAAQCFVFFAAGFETSSTLMGFCLHELVVNTHIQDRLRSEIDSVLSKHGGQITYEAIQEMEYLDKVINETLRKYPPVPTLVRECMQPYNIPDSDLVLQKGTRIWVGTLGLHHDEEHYPNPEKFDPERFSRENKETRHHYAFLPFGEGPRNCIGMRFALAQSKVGIVSLLSKLKFNRCSKTSMPIKFDKKALALGSDNGHWATVSPRN